MYESPEAQLKARIANLESFVKKTAGSSDTAELLELKIAEEHLKVLRYELESLTGEES